MSWSSLGKIKASSIFVFIFGVYTFFIGFMYTQMPDKLSEQQKLFISFVGAPALALALLSLVNYSISKEVEADVNQKLDTKEKELEYESQNKLESEIEYFMKEFQDKLKQLDTKINSFTYSQYRDDLLEISNSLNFAPKNFKAQRQANKEIVKWFDTPGNKLDLLNTALKAVSQAKCNIPKKHKQKFDDDIDQCINWLHDSVIERTGCVVERSKHASVIVHIPEKYKPYEVALRAIENHLKEKQELKQYYEKADTVQKVLDYLINELKTLSA
ncbi:hypothetical protein JYQ62_28480 [Nostoc sp. UHCC 0702]|nr:hypothetical protein JYQ62_28480 [Nostoc sp. UHCC 0702]